MHVHASVFANKSKHSNVQQYNQTWKDKYIWKSCQKQKNIMYTDLFLLSPDIFTRIKLKHFKKSIPSVFSEQFTIVWKSTHNSTYQTCILKPSAIYYICIHFVT